MSKEDISRSEGYWVFILSVISLFALQRLMPGGMSLWYDLLPQYDYNIYYLIGNEWMNGNLPYVSHADIKGPLVFLFYGVGSLLSPRSFLGVTVLHSLVLGIGLLYAYKTARLFLSVGLSVLCIFFYTIYMGHGDLAPSMHALVMEHVTMFYVIRWAMRGGRFSCGEMFSMGCFVAAALMLKFNQSAFWIPVSILVLYVNRLRGLLWLSIGFLSVFIPIILYFYFNEALYAMWHEYVEMALGYGSAPWKDSALGKYGFWVLFHMAPVRMVYKVIPGTIFSLGTLYMLFGWIALWCYKEYHLKRSACIVLLASLVCVVLANYLGYHCFFHYSYILYVFFLLSIIVMIKFLAGLLSRRLLYAVSITVLMVLYGYFYVAQSVKVLTSTEVVHVQKQVSIQMMKLIDTLEDKDFFVLDAGCMLHYYRLSGKSPKILHFFSQIVPGGIATHRGEQAEYIRQHKPRYLIGTIEWSRDQLMVIEKSGIAYRSISHGQLGLPPMPEEWKRREVILYERVE